MEFYNKFIRILRWIRWQIYTISLTNFEVHQNPYEHEDILKTC